MEQHIQILVVDGDPVSRETLVDLLTETPCNIIEADSGEAALRLARERHPGLVLLTVSSNGHNGRHGDVDSCEVCQRLKSDPALSDILVVLLSEDTMTSEEMIDGLEVGADGYLLRPYPNRQPDVPDHDFRGQDIANRHLGNRDFAARDFLAQIKRYIQLAVAVERTRLFEHAHRVLEERLQTVVSTIPIILFAADSRGTVTLIKGRDLASLGVMPDECVGQPVSEAFAEYPGFMEVVQRALNGEQVNLAVESGGRLYDVWGSPVRDQTGAVAGVVGIGTDITERREPECELDHQQRLAAVGQLAGGIAHDFRNFLTTIALYADQLRRDQRLPDDLKPAADTIIKESHRASDLVRQILDFSRRSPIETRVIDLVRFLNEIAAVLRKTLPESIRLITDIAPGVAPVNADATRIQQMVMNLVSNARDAMPQGGKLQIGLRALDLRPGDPLPLPSMSAGRWVCLSVADTGHGMSEDVLAHLFEPFYTTKGSSGTGLGLSQVYGIVQQHQGHIDVQSSVGQGTVFRIYLPLARTEHVTPPPPNAHSRTESRSQGESVMVVQEAERVQSSARDCQASERCRIEAVTDERDTPEAGNAEQQEADGPAPVVTGSSATHFGGRALHLSDVSPGARIPSLSAEPLESARDLKDLGFLDFISRPLDAVTLTSTVRRLLDAS